MKQKYRQKWDSAVYWTSHRARGELRIRVCVHSAVQKKGAKMLHLKERGTKETGGENLVSSFQQWRRRKKTRKIMVFWNLCSFLLLAICSLL